MIRKATESTGILPDAIAFSVLPGELARRAETPGKSEIQWVIDAKAFICKGWRRALCTFCVLGGPIRRRQLGRQGRQCGAIRRREVGRRGGPQGLLYYAGHPGIWGGGVAEKQPVPSGRGVGYIIRTHFPIPWHLTALCRTSSLLAKLPPVFHHYPHTACRGTRRGCRKRGRWGLWKRRGEIITGNSPGYGWICRGPVSARMAWATNLCE